MSIAPFVGAALPAVTVTLASPIVAPSCASPPATTTTSVPAMTSARPTARSLVPVDAPINPVASSAAITVAEPLVAVSVPSRTLPVSERSDATSRARTLPPAPAKTSPPVEIADRFAPASPASSPACSTIAAPLKSTRLASTLAMPAALACLRSSRPTECAMTSSPATAWSIDSVLPLSAATSSPAVNMVAISPVAARSAIVPPASCRMTEALPLVSSTISAAALPDVPIVRLSAPVRLLSHALAPT